jgi:hypothetical protein
MGRLLLWLLRLLLLLKLLCMHAPSRAGVLLLLLLLLLLLTSPRHQAPLAVYVAADCTVTASRSRKSARSWPPAAQCEAQGGAWSESAAANAHMHAPPAPSHQPRTQQAASRHTHLRPTAP